MADSDRRYAQEFLRIFQDSRSDLEARIVSAKNVAPANPSVVNDLAQDLARLSKSLADVNDKLPTYDQRQLGLQAKAMETMIEELRAASKPKSKFAFRRTVAPGPDVPQRPPPKTNIDNTSSGDVSAQGNKSQRSILSSRSYHYISFTDLLPTDQPSSELTISGLDHCVVNLIRQGDNDIQLSTINVKNVSHSVLILPMINGSILLNDLTRCVIAVGCHQFRMHDSKQVHVYLSITSNPVIEHCSEIGFAAYPDIPGNQCVHVNKENNHLAVQDFSHIRSSPSPHWFALQSDSIMKSWPTAEIQDNSLMETMLPPLLPHPTQPD